MTGDRAGEFTLFDGEGQRKYLTEREAQSLLAQADLDGPQTRLFCRLLYFTGCRISEALQITSRRIDAETSRVIFRTLKRRRTVYRAVPIPPALLRELQGFGRAERLTLDDRLFPWCRQTGWRRIHALVRRAGINGPQGTAKGFRHQFGCHGIRSGLPESLVGRLLGHANPHSTRVYTHLLGDDELELVRRMWNQNE